MSEFLKYLALGFSALLPLINPPGSAMEFLGVIGVSANTPYKVLACKIAINTTMFLVVVGLTGPYILQFFGISVEILQCVGGAVLVAMGWQLLNKPDDNENVGDAGVIKEARDQAGDYWAARVFYPLTFPITVGPGSVAVMLTLSAQAKTLALAARIPAFAGLVVSAILLSVIVYICYAYAPTVAKRFPAPIVNGTLRIIAFLLMCIGAQIVWHGVRSLLVATRA